MYLVKLGGSVITDKARPLAFREDVVRRIVSELDSSSPMIIVHGAGSFGHIYAEKYGLSHGFQSREQLEGFARVQRDVRDLNLRVLSVLIDAGINAVSIPPFASCLNSDGSLDYLEAAPFQRALKMGLVPVTFGDAVFDSTIGFSICSGDYLMEALALEFKPDKAVFLSDVDGIYDRNPAEEGAELLELVSSRSSISADSLRSGVSDVTGGMGGKLRSMIRIAPYSEVWMINGLVPGRLANLLNGEAVVGSKVIP